MSMDRRLALTVAAAAAVIAISTVTIYRAPSDTSILIPQPGSPGGGSADRGIQIVANNLDAPWAIDIAKDGRIFFTEITGEIRVILPNGTLIADPAAYINTQHHGESGLLGLALHPNFTENHLLYIYYTYSNSTEEKIYNKVVMLTEKDNKIIQAKVIVDRIPGADRDNGGRLKFGPDGKLYISTGDAGNPELAGDPGSLAGKILRVNPDGSIPRDNPFPGSPVYSYGHKDILGMAWNPQTGAMYASDQREGEDEINLIKAGANYGWPIVECADAEKSGKAVICFSPQISPSGMVFASSSRLGYQNDLIIATLKGQSLRLVDFKSQTQESILVGYGRMRDVIEAQDGSLYAITSNRDGEGTPQQGDDKILRITKP
jgi:glucose/arabinose dehydrogenase